MSLAFKSFVVGVQWFGSENLLAIRSSDEHGCAGLTLLLTIDQARELAVAVENAIAAHNVANRKGDDE